MTDQQNHNSRRKRQVHSISPFYDADSEMLVLGSFPSVTSRATGFFYGHPQNRFWRVLAAVFEENTPESLEDKKNFLRKYHIALWDVIASCDIDGSSDSSIKNVIPNALGNLLKKSSVKTIFLNGKTAEKLYNRYMCGEIDCKTIALPSTSPANARASFTALKQSWTVIRGVSVE